MNSLFSGLNVLEEHLWSMMLPEDMLVSMIHAATLDYDNFGDPCGYMWSLPLTAPFVMSSGFLAWGDRGHVDLSGQNSHLNPC